MRGGSMAEVAQSHQKESVVEAEGKVMGFGVVASTVVTAGVAMVAAKVEVALVGAMVVVWAVA